MVGPPGRRLVEGEVHGRLLVVSHTAHYRTPAGIVGWGPTVRELDALATLFDEVVHLAPLHQGEAPPSCLPYLSGKVRLRPVRPAGGTGVADKCNALLAVPAWSRALWQDMGGAAAVHVRCPANISLVALCLLTVCRQPRQRWIKYAGNWRPDGPEPLSYTAQRWMLRRNLCRARVTVNGRWEGDGAHVLSFPNPCFSAEEYRRARAAAVAKELHPEGDVRLLFVGSLTPRKGAQVAVEALGRLRAEGVRARLEAAGDGPMRGELEGLAARLGVREHIDFYGSLPHPRVMALHARAHFVVLPSVSEGWPKVLSEGMAHGAIPIAAAVSSIPQVLADAACGQAVSGGGPGAYAEAVFRYLRHPQTWRQQARAGADYAVRFTYEAHVERVKTLFGAEEGKR